MAENNEMMLRGTKMDQHGRFNVERNNQLFCPQVLLLSFSFSAFFDFRMEGMAAGTECIVFWRIKELSHSHRLFTQRKYFLVVI